MQRHSAQHVIQGNIEVIDQGLCLLRSLSDEQYTRVVSDYVSSSIGQHFRHILDLYRAIVHAPRKARPVLDYDSRRRGARVETCRRTAMHELAALRCKLEHCSANLQRAVAVRTEVCHEHAQSVALQSTLARELAFASCHATHHYALVAVIAKLQGARPDANIGVAPASATFARRCGDRLQRATG